MDRNGLLGALALLAVLAAGCQHDVATLFPPGLEPFDDDAMAGAVDAPVAEALVMTDTTDSLVRVYGHGYVFVPVATAWQAAQDPHTLIARCRTNAQAITPNDETGYDLDFLVHYTVNDVLTIEWDDQYRGDVIAVGVGSAQMPGSGSADEPSRTIIKHQKTGGSSFITTSEGTTQMLANADDSVTELQFVEHLGALQQPVDQVRAGMQDEFDRLLATVHGDATPACP